MLDIAAGLAGDEPAEEKHHGEEGSIDAAGRQMSVRVLARPIDSLTTLTGELLLSRN